MRLRKVTKRFDGRPALSNFSAEAEAGERILITGANGSGKTTLLRMIAGLTLPDEGELTFGGNGFSWLPICDLGFWPRLTAREGLQLYARLWGIPDRGVAEQLESWCELPAFAEILRQPVTALSTGRNQLLHLSRVLLSQPDLILMDEPFRSLDVENVRFVEAQFARWASRSLVIWSAPSPLNFVSPIFREKTWTLKPAVA